MHAAIRFRLKRSCCSSRTVPAESEIRNLGQGRGCLLERDGYNSAYDESLIIR